MNNECDDDIVSRVSASVFYYSLKGCRVLRLLSVRPPWLTGASVNRLEAKSFGRSTVALLACWRRMDQLFSSLNNRETTTKGVYSYNTFKERGVRKIYQKKEEEEVSVFCFSLSLAKRMMVDGKVPIEFLVIGIATHDSSCVIQTPRDVTPYRTKKCATPRTHVSLAKVCPWHHLEPVFISKSQHSKKQRQTKD